MKERDPTAESIFLCSDRPDDAAYLKHERVTFQVLPRPRRSPLFPVQFMRNFLISRRALRVFKPDAVFSKGGAVSVPACLAARINGVPIVLHESDAVMGRANRMVARWAEAVCMGFPLAIGNQQLAVNKKTSRYLLPATRYHTGNPIRPAVTQGKRTEGLRITGLSGERPILLVTGGSQGAEVFNAAIRKHIDRLLQTCDVIHLTGTGKKAATARAGYWTTEFAYDELPHLYAIANIALSRAGAGSISELAANGIPAILVPIEGLANDHQVRNAEIATEHGGCVLLRQSDLNAQLTQTVASLLEKPQELADRKAKMRAFQQPDAARRIAEILSQCIARRHEGH